MLGQHFSSPSYWPSLYSMGGFIGRSAGKESTCNTVDPSSIPGIEISPGEGTGLLGYPVSHSSILGFPWWLLKHLLAMQRPRFNPWVDKIPWRREELPTPVFWPGEFHGLYSSWGLQRVRQDWATFTLFFFLYSMLITQKVLLVSLQDLQQYLGRLWNTLKIFSDFYPKRNRKTRRA